MFLPVPQLVIATSLLQLLQAVPFQLPIMQEYLERNKNNVTMNMRVYEINDNDLHLSCVVLTAPYTPGRISGTHLLLELLHCSNPDQLLLTWWSYNCHNSTWTLLLILLSLNNSFPPIPWKIFNLKENNILVLINAKDYHDNNDTTDTF